MQIGIGTAVGGLTAGALPLVTDAFTRADSALTLGSADTGQAWTAVNGTGGIASNKGYFAAISGDGAALLESGVSNGRVGDTITFGATGDGVLFRAADYANFLEVIIQTTQITLFKKAAGSFTSLKNTAGTYTVGVTYRLEVTFRGTAIEVFIDGVSVLTHTLSGGDQTAFGSNTLVGIRSTSTSTRHDDFRVSR